MWPVSSLFWRLDWLNMAADADDVQWHVHQWLCQCLPSHTDRQTEALQQSICILCCFHRRLLLLLRSADSFSAHSKLSKLASQRTLTYIWQYNWKTFTSWECKDNNLFIARYIHWLFKDSTHTLKSGAHCEYWNRYRFRCAFSFSSFSTFDFCWLFLAVKFSDEWGSSLLLLNWGYSFLRFLFFIIFFSSLPYCPLALVMLTGDCHRCHYPDNLSPTTLHAVSAD